MEARDMFAMALGRLERASADARGSMDAERRLEIRLERIEPELKATAEKLGEWIDYSRKLRAIVLDINAKAPKRQKQIPMPPEPGPVELPIPF